MFFINNWDLVIESLPLSCAQGTEIDKAICICKIIFWMKLIKHFGYLFILKKAGILIFWVMNNIWLFIVDVNIIWIKAIFIINFYKVGYLLLNWLNFAIVFCEWILILTSYHYKNILVKIRQSSIFKFWVEIIRSRPIRRKWFFTIHFLILYF